MESERTTSQAKFKSEKYSRLGIVVLMIFFSAGRNEILKAQQTPLVSHYFYNPYLINPALAGQAGEARAFFLYRKQWVGIPDSPETQIFTLDGPLTGKKFGVGITVANDASHIVGRLTAMISGSYRVTFNDDNDLSFGMSGGVLRNQINFDKIHADVSDPEILQSVETRSIVEGNAGISYRFKKFRVGFVSEQLFNRSLSYQRNPDFAPVSFALVRHYLLTAQYAFALKENVELVPLIAVRSTQGLPAQLDVNATIKFKNQYWFNTAYRHGTGVGLAAGAVIGEQFVVGYNYEVSTSALRQISSGSHEFVIGMKFLSRQSGGSSEKIKPKAIEAIKKESDAQYEKLDAIQQQNELLNRQVAEYKAVIDRQNNEIEKLRQSVNSFDSELKAAIEKLKVDIQKEESFDKKQTYYLVVGATRTLADAKSLQKILKRETRLNPEIIQSESQTWYFIYSDVVHTPREAQKKMKALDTHAIRPYLIGNPWIYKSEKSNP